jgi:hypothetical protein
MRVNFKIGSSGSSLGPVSITTGGTVTGVSALTASDIIVSAQAKTIAIGLTPAWNGTVAFYLYSPSDGVVRLTNGAADDINRVCFGGLTAAFPALKRSGTSLEVRLADDSAYGGIKVLSLETTGAVSLAGNVWHLGGGSQRLFFAPSNGVTIVKGDGIVLRNTSDADILTVQTNGLTTLAPTGGVAAAWKLGAYSATAPTPTGKVRVEIGGSVFLIPAEAI